MLHILFSLNSGDCGLPLQSLEHEKLAILGSEEDEEKMTRTLSFSHSSFPGPHLLF